VELAEQLGLKVGGEVVLVGQAADGSVANDRYTVVGLGDAGSSELNSTAVFLHLADAQDFFGLGEAVHALVVRLPTDEEDVSGPVGAARAALDLRALEALSWNELLPELKGTMTAKRKNQHFIDVIVFLIVALGALNAMTMSTFERTREFGVMLAVGTRPGRLLRQVMTEALLQGALGLALGVALSLAFLLALADVDLGALAKNDLLGVRLPRVVQLRLYPEAVLSAAVTVLATMLVGGLLPALRAARLRPADAVRAD
jgi:ABC-type lipoprotein release transport system permease subunit